MALAVLERDCAFLMWVGRDPDAGAWFRPLGGGIQFGETGEAAVVREVMEEIGERVEVIEQVGVLEDIYDSAERPIHEIVLVYRARFARDDVDDVLWVESDDGPELRWVRREELGHVRVYPPGLVDLIAPMGDSGSGEPPRSPTV